MADRSVRSVPGGVVGRAPEISTLSGALTAVGRGRGRAVLLEGEPGIGKSALVDAALTQVPAEVRVLRGVCDEWGRRYALSALISALDDASAAELPSAHAFAAGAVPRSVAGDAVMAAVDALLLLVERLCATGPVVFVLEDLHWADEATLMFWRELCGRTGRLPLLLIGTRRPVPRRALLDRLREEVVELDGLALSLSRLAPDEVAELAARLLGSAPGASLLTLLETASGNPLYIRELLDALSGLSATELPDLPASLADTLADWLDLLAPGSLDVLRGAAVLGAEFSLRELSVLLNRPSVELRVLLEEAIAAGLLEGEDSVLRFRHELIRRKLYEAMPAGLRIALHRYTAKILNGLSAQPERVARHLLAGLDEAERWEADWLVEHAAAVFAREPEIAVELIGQVLRGLDPDDPRHAPLEDQWARFTFRIDRYEQAGRIARGILTRAVEPARIGPAVWVLALSLMTAARFAEALKLLEETGRRSGIPVLWRARHDAVRAISLQLLGRLDEGYVAAERALAAELTPMDPFTTTVALYLRSTVRATRRDLAGALQDVQRALGIVIQDSDLADVRMLLLGNWHTYRFALGRHAGVATAMRRVLAMAERTDSPWLARVRRQAAELLYDFGDWAEATAHLQPYQENLRHAIGALVAAHRDDSAEVSRHLKALGSVRAADEEPGPVTLVSSNIHALSARALECERNGSPGDGAAVLSVCLEPGSRSRFPLRHLVMPTLVRLAWAAKDPEMARAAAEAAAWEAEQERTARKRACADWCRGILEADPAPILRAVDYYRVAGLRLDAGNALEDAAELLAQAGDAEWARQVLREAFAVYEELGATWDARRGAARLRAYDVRLGVTGSRARAGSGGQGLTATERRVAELAAEGCSNPDIASRMFLSRRTVETHVSNILAKLQIGSRREIRDRLAEEGL